jgi:hypothetical protein
MVLFYSPILIYNTIDQSSNASSGFFNKQYIVVSPTKCAGCVHSCSEQCCYRTFDLNEDVVFASVASEILGPIARTAGHSWYGKTWNFDLSIVIQPVPSANTIYMYALAYANKYAVDKPEILGWIKAFSYLTVMLEASKLCEIWGFHGTREYLLPEGSEAFIYDINPLTPKLNPSAQRCLTRFLLVILLLEPCISLMYAWKPTNATIIHSVY